MADYGAFAALHGYSICPVPLFTPLSLELWKLYNACGGTERLVRPADYYQLPALYVEACGIIETEVRKIQRMITDGGE